MAVGTLEFEKWMSSPLLGRPCLHVWCFEGHCDWVGCYCLENVRQNCTWTSMDGAAISTVFTVTTLYLVKSAFPNIP